MPSPMAPAIRMSTKINAAICPSLRSAHGARKARSYRPPRPPASGPSTFNVQSAPSNHPSAVLWQRMRKAASGPYAWTLHMA